MGKFKIYPPDEGLTKQELQKGYQWLYTDVECPHCHYNQAVANTQYVGGPCMRCGKLTSGDETDEEVCGLDELAIAFNNMFDDRKFSLNIPNKLEMERLLVYSENDKCKCEKGRLRLQIIPGNIGDNLVIYCNKCGFEDIITDLDNF